jgi:hypothetical protein
LFRCSPLLNNKKPGDSGGLARGFARPAGGEAGLIFNENSPQKAKRKCGVSLPVDHPGLARQPGAFF